MAILAKRAILVLAVLTISAGAALAAGNTVEVKSKDGLGSYLADSKGMTLYYFKNDSAGKSACAGSCVEKWPVFSVDTVAATGTLQAGDFGTITREDGRKQSTYKGMPLYYFAGDTYPGDTKGQGIKDIWYVAAP